MTDPIQDVAAATAECGMQSWLPNYLPADRHADLRELLHDLAVGAMTAHLDARSGWYDVPPPSPN